MKIIIATDRIGVKTHINADKIVTYFKTKNPYDGIIGTIIRTVSDTIEINGDFTDRISEFASTDNSGILDLTGLTE